MVALLTSSEKFVERRVARDDFQPQPEDVHGTGWIWDGVGGEKMISFRCSRPLTQNEETDLVERIKSFAGAKALKAPKEILWHSSFSDGKPRVTIKNK